MYGLLRVNVVGWVLLMIVCDLFGWLLAEVVCCVFNGCLWLVFSLGWVLMRSGC